MRDELYHHGILGMHWGDKNGPPYPLKSKDHSASEKKAGWRKSLDNNSDARIIKKGTKVYRITNDKNDSTYDRKKYVSLSKQDHKKWQEYIGEAYTKQGIQAYDIKYKTVKDLKIAPYTKLGELFLKDQTGLSKAQIITDSREAQRILNQDTDDLLDVLSMNFAVQTATGKAYVNKLLELGYDGIEDNHGRNVADDPIIIFNPDVNMKTKRIKKYKHK